MSIERTALRLGVCMALANGFETPYPTMARGRVFDSRFDPLQIVDLDEVMPVVTVCVDDDTGEAVSANNGGPIWSHEVKLVLELSIGRVGDSSDHSGAVPTMQLMPASDPQLEAMLDLFERQIKRALIDPVAVWSRALDQVHKGIMDWHSHHYVEPGSNVRLAARRVQATVRLQDEDLILVINPDDDALEPSIPSPLGPLLAQIAASSSPWAAEAEAMTDLLLDAGAGATVSLPRLERVRFVEIPQAELQDDVAWGPRPDGVAQANLPNP